MEIESDHLVYEYLSRVGDLAQQRQMPSGDRMRLVAGLRDEIDRRRAKYEPETPDAVRHILRRIGTPEDVLDGVGTPSGEDAAPRAEAGAVPAQRAPRRVAPAADRAEPDWWRVTPSPYGGAVQGRGPQVEGFTGGIEIPELLVRPEDREEAEAEAGKRPGGATENTENAKDAKAVGEAAPKQTLARYVRERRRAKKEAAAAPEAAPAKAPAAAAPLRPHALLLLAAAVLVAGVVTGFWLLLIGGWVLAYASRVLGPTERKAVVFGLPGAVFAGAVVWLWGRLEGRWGEPLTDEGLGGVFQGMWPWLARGAALASAAYLIWRARRR
ncbi:hypothetical protein ACSHWO_19260 [Streptomyces sp. HUAS TT3]|uniref:hypothetical protein n=1 Tax=Streptomyces sp. HUAS TT3 TaxID=3447510 RepID=UPI003F656CDF